MSGAGVIVDGVVSTAKYFFCDMFLVQPESACLLLLTCAAVFIDTSRRFVRRTLRLTVHV